MPSQEQRSSSQRRPSSRTPKSPLTDAHLGERFLGLPIDFDFYFSEAAISAADLFLADDLAQIEYYRSLGYFRRWPAPDASLGDALLAGGPAPARVVCANLGIGALDAAFAAHLVSVARAEGVGIVLPR